MRRKTLFFCNSIFAGRLSVRISFPVSCVLLLMLLFMQRPHCRSMLTAQLQCFNTQSSQARLFYTQKYIYPASPYCLPVAHFTRVRHCHSLLFTYLNIYSRLAHFTPMSLWSLMMSASHLMMSASHVTKPLTESQSQHSLRVPTRPALISPRVSRTP